MEFVYKLKLPPLHKILREDRVSMLGVASDHPIYVAQDPATLIKSEWLTINGFTWDCALYFFKPTNFVGRVHTDVIDLDSNVWGINWIWGASGLLNHWYHESIQPFEKKIDEQGFPIWNYPTDIPPDRSYLMEPGAYLTNVQYPHQPVSHGNRHCVSVRCSPAYKFTWEQIVKTFKNYIE